MDKIAAFIQNPSLAVLVIVVILALKDFGLYPTLEQVTDRFVSKEALEIQVKAINDKQTIILDDVKDVKKLLIEHIREK